MWDSFAALVVSRGPHRPHDTRCATAHLVMDALQESGAQGGAWVEVK